MTLNEFLKRERALWHNHFVPSLIAGVGVAIVALVFEFTVSNIVLFASVGASAAILANVHSHHLTKLHTTIISYAVAIIISLLLYFINTLISLPLALNLFLVVFLVGIVVFLFNSFHPPAISAGVSFFLFERCLLDLLYLFLAIIVLFTIIRFLTYIISQHLAVREFWKEFKKEF